MGIIGGEMGFGSGQWRKTVERAGVWSWRRMEKSEMGFGKREAPLNHHAFTQANPTSCPAASAASSSMSPSNSTKPYRPESTQQRQSSEPRTPIQETPDPPTDIKTAGIHEKEAVFEKDAEEPMNDGDEEGECGFCLFMKGGGCKETFVEWEKCIEEAEKKEDDVVQMCFQATTFLKKCMEAHSDYYAPILQAEKSLEEEAVKQLEEEKEKLSGEGVGVAVGGRQESEKKEALGGNDSKKQS
ncbi:uncharacterized protein LOC130994031 [Salvia miltiorrhiza]|uniref:uncharacterized protein LOC130994031 n=1 Tax=Salvia miltiorrhiza TaxID=226208 RepID=UPI0025AD2A47|nr:uncharacterized protein LOC130994031 [Salvia miltiorrhiza]